MAKEERLEPVMMEGVSLIFRNFRGEKTDYNDEGTRNFGVLLPDDVAEAMAADDWNVKYLNPRDEAEDDYRQPWLPVEVAFHKGRPPLVVQITSRGRTNMVESQVELLDGVDITNVDMIVNPSRWEVNGRGGVKAYLKSIYVTIEEDELEKKYSELDVQ